MQGLWGGEGGYGSKRCPHQKVILLAKLLANYQAGGKTVREIPLPSPYTMVIILFISIHCCILQTGSPPPFSTTTHTHPLTSTYATYPHSHQSTSTCTLSHNPHLYPILQSLTKQHLTTSTPSHLTASTYNQSYNLYLYPFSQSSPMQHLTTSTPSQSYNLHLYPISQSSPMQHLTTSTRTPAIFHPYPIL